MNFLFTFPDFTKPVENFPDRLIFGGLMLLIGMAVVFAVLIIIWACLAIFKYAFAGKEPKQKKPAPVPAPIKQVYTPTDAEIVAVIAAAIAAAESENSGMKFRVVSFKRK